MFCQAAGHGQRRKHRRDTFLPAMMMMTLILVVDLWTMIPCGRAGPDPLIVSVKHCPSCHTVVDFGGMKV